MSSVLILLAGVAAMWLPSLQIFLWLGLVCLLALLAYVARGWHLSGVGAQGLKDFVHVPGFIFWKVILMLRGSSSGEWIRTDREPR
jgi:1,2-diacylglycerol 3-beta-glucosyltransferase